MRHSHPPERTVRYGRVAKSNPIMVFTTYVLADNRGRLYKGVTADLDKRLYDHQRGKTRTTSRMQGLRVVYTEKFDTFELARKREVYFKTAAGRRFLKAALKEGL